MILGIQIIGLIFGLAMAYFIFLHYRRKEFSRMQFFMWEIIWVIYIIFILFPNISSGLIYRLGIVRAMDLFTILGFMFIFFFSFFNYFSILKIKNKIEENVRREALKELEKKE